MHYNLSGEDSRDLLMIPRNTEIVSMTIKQIAIELKTTYQVISYLVKKHNLPKQKHYELELINDLMKQRRSYVTIDRKQSLIKAVASGEKQEVKPKPVPQFIPEKVIKHNYAPVPHAEDYLDPRDILFKAINTAQSGHAVVMNRKTLGSLDALQIVRILIDADCQFSWEKRSIKIYGCKLKNERPNFDDIEELVDEIVEDTAGE